MVRSARSGARAGHGRSRLAHAGLPALAALLLLLPAACSRDWSLADGDGAPETSGDADGALDAPADDGDGALDALDTGGDALPDDAAADGDAFDDIPPPRCGDGVVDPGEECEPPGDTERCPSGSCPGTRRCGDDCRWGPCDFGAAPPGDTCDAPDALTPLVDVLGTQTITGTTCGATDDGAATACGPAAGPDVLVRLDLTHNRYVTFDTVGSHFDAVVRVLEGPACDGAELACDDDSSDVSAGQAELPLLLSAGSYWVAIDGKDDAARGAYTLNVDIADAGLPPANDLCTGAVTLTLSRNARTRSGTTSGAGSYAPGCALGRGPDVWYRFTLAVRTLVYLDLLDGETWNGVLEVMRAGPLPCTAPTSVACADDACGTLRPRFVDVLDPGDYYIRVDGRALHDAGAFQLTYQGISDACALGATPLAADGTVTGALTGLDDAVSPRCTLSFGVPDAFYSFVACAGAPLTATTCDAGTDFDTVLAIYGGGCSNELECNDNMTGRCPEMPLSGASTLSFTPSSSGLYLLDVTGRGAGGSGGRFGLTVSGL